MSEMCFSSLALHFRTATLGGKRQRMHWMILDGSGVAVKERVASCNVVFLGGLFAQGELQEPEQSTQLALLHCLAAS